MKARFSFLVNVAAFAGVAGSIIGAVLIFVGVVQFFQTRVFLVPILLAVGGLLTITSALLINELVLVLVSIEENTKRSADCLEALTKRRNADK